MATITERPLEDLTTAASAAGEDLARCLELARGWGTTLPHPGSGNTRARWKILQAAAAGGLTAARVLEPHVDALSILHEAQVPAATGVWGVFAAEGPGVRLVATQDDHGWVLNGTKPWCSLGGRLDHALVTAHVGDQRQLFAVDLHHEGAHATVGTWFARGLRVVDSGPIDFSDVPAQPVGDAQWYLTRPGFAWGAIGVAACWLGGAQSLVDSLTHRLVGHDPDRVRLLNLGAADAAYFGATSSLDAAANEVDSGRATGRDGAILAARVRAVIHDACELIVRQVGHALGPAPLAFDEEYARRVADLEIYLRQHHGERDLADLGAQVVDGAQT